MPPKKRRYKVRYALLIALAIAYLSVNLLFLDKYPLVWLDEPWVAEKGWTFLQEGTFGQKMFEGYYGFEKKAGIFGTISHFPFAIIFKLFGVGAYQARLWPFFCGLVTLWFTYLVGKTLYNRRIGLTAALLLAVSRSFVINSHDARRDMMLAMFIIIAVYIFLVARKKQSGALFTLSGLVAGISMDVHVNGVITPVAIGMLLLLEHGRKVFGKRDSWIYVLGVLAGVSCWAALEILPDPSLFWVQLRIVAPSNTNILSNFGSLGRFLSLFPLEAKRWIDYFRGRFYQGIPEFFFIVAAVVAATQRRQKSDKQLLAIIGTFVLMFTLIVNNKTTLYLIYLWPFFMLLISSFFYQLIDQQEIGEIVRRCVSIGDPRGRAKRNGGISSFRRLTANLDKIGKRAVMGIALMTVLFSYYILLAAASFYYYRNADYDAFIHKLREYIPRDAVVVGQPTWWYGFYEQPYYAAHYFKFLVNPYDEEMRDELGHTFAEAIRIKQVDYIIADEFFYYQMNEQKSLPADQIMPFLAEDCQLVGVVWDQHFGHAVEGGDHRTEIYKVDIDRR